MDVNNRIIEGVKYSCLKRSCAWRKGNYCLRVTCPYNKCREEKAWFYENKIPVKIRENNYDYEYL